MNYQVHNFTQSMSVAFSFPDTDANAEQNYDTVDLAFADGDRMGIYHASGSRIISDLEIVLRT